LPGCKNLSNSVVEPVPPAAVKGNLRAMLVLCKAGAAVLVVQGNHDDMRSCHPQSVRPHVCVAGEPVDVKKGGQRARPLLYRCIQQAAALRLGQQEGKYTRPARGSLSALPYRK